MKLRLQILVLLSVMALFLAAPLSYSRNGNAITTARQLKELTDSTLTNTTKTVESLNADSLAETVVLDRQSADDSDNDNGFWNAALLIPIFGIVFGLLTPAAVVVLIAFFICQTQRYKVRERNEIIRQAIAAGYQLPDSFYRQEKTVKHLRSGIVWIGWGVAFAIMFFMFRSGSIWLPIGIIFIAIGVSRIVVYYISKKDAEIAAEREQQDA